jgi:hypothetical protein
MPSPLPYQEHATVVRYTPRVSPPVLLLQTTFSVSYYNMIFSAAKVIQNTNPHKTLAWKSVIIFNSAVFQLIEWILSTLCPPQGVDKYEWDNECQATD